MMSYALVMSGHVQMHVQMHMHMILYIVFFLPFWQDATSSQHAGQQ